MILYSKVLYFHYYFNTFDGIILVIACSGLASVSGRNKKLNYDFIKHITAQDILQNYKK